MSSTISTGTPAVKPITIFRVLWERENGLPRRSKRFRSVYPARRFIRSLWENQDEYGEVLWVRLERAVGTIGPWEEVDET